MPAVGLLRETTLHCSKKSLKQHGKISRQNRSPTFLTSSVKEKRGKPSMETGPWIDRERAIWKVLPLHPQPQPLESFTSYIMRLAEANGLKSINELATLADTRWSRVHTSPDYPCPPYEGLARITGCTETRLGRMTFLPLHGNKKEPQWRRLPSALLHSDTRGTSP